mmetsp:Transcript_1078/g.3037  ORF Transcript_1078/g.3037 Transcript_1078/m.3037 type:complete len:205 (+) Transcript_1078:529-1143(+)
MVGVPVLLPLAPPPRCLGGSGDAVPAPVSSAAAPVDALVVVLVGPLAASNLGGRTGVTTASVMASMGARIHVVTSLQSGLLLAEEEAATLELVPAEEVGAGAPSRGASSSCPPRSLDLALAILAVLGPAMVISKRDTSTSSLPSTVNAASAKAFSVKVTGGDSSMLVVMPKGSALGAPPLLAGRTRRSASARKVRWMGGVTSKL